MEEFFISKSSEKNEDTENYQKEMQKFFCDYSFEQDTSNTAVDDNGKKKYINKNREILKDTEKNKNIEVLKSLEKLGLFFEKAGFKNTKPVSVVKEDGTTLYVSSGVQILDSVIHLETEIPSEKIFIPQPVIRTQFIDSIGDYVSTSFINLSTESVNNDVTDHFNDVRKWFDFLSSIGISSNDINVIEKNSNQKWGKREFYNHVLKFHYKDLEIGDAVYIPTMPQDSRPSISISDIGFGIERLSAICKNDSYFNNLVNNNSDLVSVSDKILDYIRTLTLIAASGVEPSNNNHGYRFRLFAKRFVQQNLNVPFKIRKLIIFFYDEWNRWSALSVDKDKTIAIIMKEIERNLNRIMLDEVNKTYKLVGIEINRATKDFLIALKNSGLKDEEIQLLVKKYKIYD